jgi:pantoate--beta-alanine ligase
MKFFKEAKYLIQEIDHQKYKGDKIGFIPTMGALHAGHISLAERSLMDGNFTVFSIFINPKQFDNPKDLELYPRFIERDIEILYNSGVNAVYFPEVEDIYQSNYQDVKIDLGNLELILEGAIRPGHFQGVAKVVKRFFEIVKPDHAYFGQKDFQQTLIIKRLITAFIFTVKMHICPIVREANGLAMSSRNERLEIAERKKAGFIYQTLLSLREDLKNIPLSVAVEAAINKIKATENATLEYLFVANGKTLEEIKYIDETNNAVALIAVKYGGVRLLDNMIITPDN